jgi:hypothetical protein
MCVGPVATDVKETVGEAESVFVYEPVCIYDKSAFNSRVRLLIAPTTHQNYHISYYVD